MMKTASHAILLCLIFCTVGAMAQERPAYKLFSANGKKSDYGRMVKQMAKADIVLFGELHNSSIAHWLQLAVTKDLHPLRSLVLGAEMLEADDQQTLNRYLKGEIDSKALDTLARLWNNHATDYAPLVDFAKEQNLPFIATNVPRRYASMVYKKGFAALDTLGADERAWISPLPMAYDAELPGYKGMMAMMGGHGGENLPKAQALKDATMAHFILSNFENGKLFIHFNGAYHSDNYEGILWYLRKQRPELKVVTVSTVQQTDLRKLEPEYVGKADFIICVDTDIPGSY
jgi:uncharacterized iron-regulated protein